MPRCLLVDDDPEIRTLVADYLQGYGIEVRSVADGPSMRRELNVQPPRYDLVLLDLMLPGESGLDLCRWLRSQAPSLPLIMLTAQGDPISRVIGLELGADDYIAKPFEPRELVARVNALLRRARAAPNTPVCGAASVRFEGWTLDRLQRQLSSPQRVLVALSNAEFRLLSAFVDNPGRVLSRDQLLELTREGGAGITDRSIDLAVSRLRQKLGDPTREPGLIRTVRGAGYQFNAKVDQ